jgi:hypothetical protein
VGPFYVPIAICAGFLFTFLTTITIRFVVRKFGYWKQRIGGMAASA